MNDTSTGSMGSEAEGAFEPHPQYRVVHGRAHRKSPSRVGTPALTRHYAFWIPSTPQTDASNFRSERDDWIARIDWFLASLILNAYEDWQKRLRKIQASDRSSKFQRRWLLEKSLVPMSFNAEDPRVNRDEDPPKYLFQFFRHTALYQSTGLIETGRVRFQPNDSVKQEAQEYVDLSGHGVWDPENAPPPPEDMEMPDGGEDRFETVSFRIFLGVIPIKVRAELHTEYFTLSFTAELDADDTASRRVGGDTRVAKIKEHFGVLSDIVRRRCNDRGSSRSRAQESARTRNHIAEAMKPCAYLVDEFWREIDEMFIVPAFRPTIPHPLSKSSQRTPPVDSIRDRLGGYITDCRGIVLALDHTDTWSIVPPFVPPERSTLLEYVGLDKAFTNEQAIDVFGALEPIVDAARQASASDAVQQAAEVRPDKRVFEYAVSSIQRQRALYISALAPQPLWSDHHDPLCYFVVTRHRHRWQIGRFLDRMNMLGTLRVASLMEYPSLNLAGFKLRDLERRLNSLDSRASDAESRRVEADELHRDYREILSSVPDGGLLYRLDRSIFYMRNFRAEVDAMKFKRVEGFQAYPSFVERRLGQTWDFLMTLRTRAVQLGVRLGALSNDIRAEQEYAQTVDLRRLSDFAEKAAAVPIAYYGGHALEHIVHPWVGESIWRFAKHMTPLGIMMPEHMHHEHPVLAIYMILAGVLYWRVMIFVKQQRQKQDVAQHRKKEIAKSSKNENA